MLIHTIAKMYTPPLHALQIPTERPYPDSNARYRRTVLPRRTLLQTVS